jgi:hypothetical protein
MRQSALTCSTSSVRRTRTVLRVGGRPQQRVRPAVQQLLDSMTVPAFVQNGRLDVLYGNRLGRALFSDLFADVGGAPNAARYIFLNPRATDFFKEWHNIANDVVALLRAEAGRDPYDRGLSDLIGELSTQSEDFRVRWARHDVRFHRSGTKHFHHPVVGDLTLTYEALEPPADPGQSIFVYMAEPNSPSQEALDLLASWTATSPDVSTADAEQEA